jgi:hypothetical protein
MTAATAVKKRSTGGEIEEGGWSIEDGVREVSVRAMMCIESVEVGMR